MQGYAFCTGYRLQYLHLIFQLGILLNSFKWMLDVLRPKIEAQLKSWGSCTIDGGNAAPGEYLSEVTVMLRTKFRNYLQAVVEKLAENVGTLQSGNTLIIRYFSVL